MQISSMPCGSCIGNNQRQIAVILHKRLEPEALALQEHEYRIS